MGGGIYIIRIVALLSLTILHSRVIKRSIVNIYKFFQHPLSPSFLKEKEKESQVKEPIIISVPENQHIKENLL